MSKIDNPQPGKFLSTRDAAARLGVALSTVQSWVESGVLPAWKTAGGHRRVSIDAIEAMCMQQQAVLGIPALPEVLKVLVVENDPIQRELYRFHFDEWRLPILLLTDEDGFEGLMLIGRHSPKLVITDLSMPEMDGFKMIRRMQMQSAETEATLLIVTALTAAEIEAQGGLPPGIPAYPKPIPFTALRPLVEHLARKVTA